MLIFSRKPGQKIRIGNDIEVTILEVKGRMVRVGIEAPKGVSIHREEVFLKIQEENIKAAASVNRLDLLDDMDITTTDAGKPSRPEQGES